MSLSVLWSSNAFWSASGYGVQAHSVLPRLQQAGHRVGQFAWYGLQGGVLHHDGIPVYPAAFHSFGTDIISGHVKHFGADVVVSLHDIWVLPDSYPELVRPARWIPYFPVDHTPIPPRTAQAARLADFPVTYSMHGLTEAHKAGITKTEYIPLGVETQVFKPGDKAEARRKLGLPQDGFICSMVAANKGQPSRKAFAENLQAFSAFRMQHPEAHLHLHTLAGQASNGVDFNELIPACGIPLENVSFCDQYDYIVGIPHGQVAALYQASDVLLAASQAEGFGIPLVEAQACNCPVITTRWTSMPELTVNGICTTPAQLVWTALDSWAAVPSVAGIYHALEEIYRWSPAQRQEQAEYGREVVQRQFDWDTIVTRYWVPFLAEVESAIMADPGPNRSRPAREEVPTL